MESSFADASAEFATLVAVLRDRHLQGVLEEARPAGLSVMCRPKHRRSARLQGTLPTVSGRSGSPGSLSSSTLDRNDAFDLGDLVNRFLRDGAT